MKLLIIGFDGLDYNIYKQYSMNGYTLHKIKSLYHVTPPDWTTIYTGVTQDLHGVDSSWTKFLKGIFMHQKYKCFWQILNQHGYKTELFNLPCTYKPHPVDGFFISGFPLPFNATDFIYPESLINELPTDFFNHVDMVHWEGWQNKNDPKGNWMGWFRSLEIKEVLERIREDNKCLMNTFINLHDVDADLGFLQFSFVDRIGHCFNSHLGKVYDDVNYIISNLKKQIEPENILVISDHGFEVGGDHTNDSVFLTTDPNLSPPLDNSDIFNIIMKVFNIPYYRNTKTDKQIQQLKKMHELKNHIVNQIKRQDLNLQKNQMRITIKIRDKYGNIKDYEKVLTGE